MTDENDHGLSADELQAAKACAMSPEEYAAWKGGADEWEALQRANRDKEEHEKLKAAIHTALDERDAAA
jgi:hypothetical protein